MAYPVENLLREATEVYSSFTLSALALVALLRPHFLLLTGGMGRHAAAALSILALYRLFQAYRIKRYHRRLVAMPYFAMSTREVPLSRHWLFIGRGFRWSPKHTQRLHQIKQVENESFMKRGVCYQGIQEYCKNHETTLLARLLRINSVFNPFRPMPDVGGKPYIHGLGNEDRVVYIPQSIRVGHTFVVGTTRVGKTRFASILINQDIRGGDAVIVVDPKGDFELIRDMYAACVTSSRLKDFRIVHLGFPEISAHYNPLKNFDQISEVATRITDAIAAEGEGKQFAAFAWKYVNIVAICLEEMNASINYQLIAFYITRLGELLMFYAAIVLPRKHPDYVMTINAMIAESRGRIDKYGKPIAPLEPAQAVLAYIKEYISDTIAKGNVESLHDQILIDLYDAAIMDKTYYDKITASVGPVLSEINKSNASGIFSFQKSPCEIELMSAIKHKKVIYIGLDSLTNPNVAQAVGKAFLSDLVSTAGKIYKESNANYRLNLHCDELSEIIQDSFVKILNKAGGAGFQVTAYAQTKQDLEVALGSKAKAEVTKGNLNTLIMLRVENDETANMLISVLPKVDVISHTQVSMVSDTPHGEEGVYFNTTNEDRIQKTAISMLEVNDITSLPKGQAFVLTNGGELYKVRIPLPLNDGLAPLDIKSMMVEVNQLGDESASNAPTEDAINQKAPTTHEPQSSKITQNDAEIKPFLNGNPDVLTDFVSWLTKRIFSGDKQFSLESQALIVCNETSFDAKTVFLLPEVLGKYQSRSSIPARTLGRALRGAYSSSHSFCIDRGGKKINVLPCILNDAFSTNYSTIIFEGEINDYDY